MTASTIAKALGGRKSGSGYIARCPAHEDRQPSLSLRDADGKILIHCHARCTQQAVISALKTLGLWPDHDQQPREDVEAVYSYTDERGNLLYQIVRKTGKKFLQRYPDGAGAWIWRKHERQVLYHLPEVSENPIIFVCEGEKDCETLRSHGFVATTNAGGANAKWLDSYTDALREREVILIPDNDVPGRQRAAAIARALLGQVAKLTVLELDDANDITEWFERGHSEVELIACIEGVIHAS